MLIKSCIARSMSFCTELRFSPENQIVVQGEPIQLRCLFHQAAMSLLKNCAITIDQSMISQGWHGKTSLVSITLDFKLLIQEEFAKDWLV